MSNGGLERTHTLKDESRGSGTAANLPVPLGTRRSRDPEPGATDLLHQPMSCVYDYLLL